MFIFFKNFNKRKGMTLIEMMVVFFIIITLSSIVLINYESIGDNLSLERSAHQLAQFVKKAERMSLSAKACPSNLNDCVGGANPPCEDKSIFGYGIVIWLTFSDEKALLYADLDDSESYEITDTRIDCLGLEKGVYIKSIIIPSTPAPVGLIYYSINFKPPSPEVKIKGTNNVNVATSLNSIEITLALRSNVNKTKIITINKAGSVEITNP